MVALAVVLFILWWFEIIKTSFAIGLGIIILAAIGIETMNYDLDLGSLWAGKSIEESRVHIPRTDSNSWAHVLCRRRVLET
jgi:hypothetical protein